VDGGRSKVLCLLASRKPRVDTARRALVSLASPVVASASIHRREGFMVRYVVLYRFTEQGRRRVKDTIHRASEIRSLNETAGFSVVGMYYTQGQYDVVAIVEAPSEEAMLTGLFAIAEEGNVTSETLRAFSPEEVQRAVGP